MTSNLEFAKRLKKVMDYYQLSAAAFADRIDVQRSSISHLLSGRNKPSLDFVLKVLEEFKTIELYWLLNGNGTFPKEGDTVSNIVTTKIAPDPVPSNEIDRIIIFYKNGTFKQYSPEEYKKS